MDVTVPPLARPLLVGRDRELAILRRHLVAALRGQGSLVLIGGEAGIGKTALADLLCHEAADAGARILTGHCYDRTETPPYGPWRECLVQFQTGGNGDAPPAAAPLSLATAPNQNVFFTQVRDFAAALAAEHPIVLLLDDLHWADTASLDLLRFLARGLASLRLLVLVTYRDEELDRRHPLAAIIPLLVHEAPTERLTLRRLDVPAARGLVAARYVLTYDEAARLAAYLIERTGGNALFLTELLHTLEEERVLRHVDGRWQIEMAAHVPVPRLLKQIVDARLVRLGDEADALLAVAAVIGHEVPFPVWEAVTQAPEDALVTLIERADAGHLVEPWERSGEGFRFAHALVREALYEGVPALRRRRLHRRVGEILAALPAPDPDMVAHHFQQAGDERAVAWLVRAAERAEVAFARRIAAERYEAAYGVLAARGETEEAGWVQLRAALLRRYENADMAAALVAETLERAVGGPYPRLVAYARIVYGYALASCGMFGAALREAQGGRHALASLPPASPAEQERERPFADYLQDGPIVVWLAFVGRLAEARAEGERLLGDAPAIPVITDDANWQAPIWSALAYTYIMQGELERAWQTDTIAGQAHDATHPRRLVIPRIRGAFVREVLACVADDPHTRNRIVAEGEGTTRRGMGPVRANERVNYAHYLRLPLLVTEGHWDEAIALAEQLVPAYTAYSVENPRRIALGAIAHARGEFGQAWQIVGKSFPEGPATAPGAMHFSFALSMQRLAVGLALDRGDRDTARAWLDAHTRWFNWSGAVLGRAGERVLWARYHQLTGQPTEAEADAQAALTAATAVHQPLVLIAAHRLLAELATIRGRFDAARDHLDAALALADACRAPYERALTLLICAELAAASSDSVGAITALNEVRALCEPLGARPALDRADTLAARLDGDRSAPAVHPGGLTAREIEVLRLVAVGLTNAQVAEQLFVSARTVNGHLTSIYTKLDVPSRAAAIRFALDHGLR